MPIHRVLKINARADVVGDDMDLVPDFGNALTVCHIDLCVLLAELGDLSPGEFDDVAVPRSRRRPTEVAGESLGPGVQNDLPRNRVANDRRENSCRAIVKGGALAVDRVHVVENVSPRPEFGQMLHQMRLQLGRRRPARNNAALQPRARPEIDRLGQFLIDGA